MADTAKDKDVIDQEDVEVEEEEETTTTTTTTKKTSQWHKTRTTKVRNGRVGKWESGKVGGKFAPAACQTDKCPTD